MLCHSYNWHQRRAQKVTKCLCYRKKVFREEPICRIIGDKLHNNLQSLKDAIAGSNIARIANAVPVTLYSKITMWLLILLFSIVRNVISVSSVKSQVTSILDCSLRVFSKCHHPDQMSHHPDQMSHRSQKSLE